MLREALRIRRAALPTPHQMSAATVNNLARAIAEQGPERRAEAIGLFRQAIEEVVKANPSAQTMIAAFRGNLGNNLWRAGEFDEGRAALLEAYEAMVKSVGPTHRRSRIIAGYLAQMYDALEDAGEAARWRALETDPSSGEIR